MNQSETEDPQLYEILITTTIDEANRLSDALEGNVLASSYIVLADPDQPGYDPENPSLETLCTLTFWVDGYPDKALLDLLPHPVTIQPLVQQDWVSIVQADFTPFQAGPFYIHSGHYPPNHAAAYSLTIDAGPAFGTGQHATTFGCLELLANLPSPPPGYLLDLGTGSAILAIAMAKIFNRPIIATDIEPMAVATAKENAEKNAVAHLIAAIAADGFSHPMLAEHAPYSLIVANILAGPLKSLAQAIAAHLAPQGIVLLSGILTSQMDDVVLHYKACGLELLHQYKRENWGCLLLARDQSIKWNKG